MSPEDKESAESLIDYLKNRVPSEFKPGISRLTYGEFVHTDIYWEDASSYCQRVTDQITLVKAFDDHRVIGVRVYEQSKGNNGKSNG